MKTHTHTEEKIRQGRRAEEQRNRWQRNKRSDGLEKIKHKDVWSYDSKATYHMS